MARRFCGQSVFIKGDRYRVCPKRRVHINNNSFGAPRRNDTLTAITATTWDMWNCQVDNDNSNSSSTVCCQFNSVTRVPKTCLALKGCLAPSGHKRVTDKQKSMNQQSFSLQHPMQGRRQIFFRKCWKSYYAWSTTFPETPDTYIR